MNFIEVKYEQTLFWSEPHPCIFIDGERLDKIVQQLCPDEDYLGLIPTLFSALHNDAQAKVVWERVLPKERASILPVLMCPDDVDLYCTLIVVEVTVMDKVVIWKRFGLDDSCGDSYVPTWLGTDVKWIQDSPTFEFDINDYRLMLKEFKEEIAKNADYIDIIKQVS
ncbi:hypothetical protein [Zooshikella harenae]|uniref:Uncharacterized protein n=1 Tax=Zooshikella harenae TaxID=2827238 RepID=A0ABS5ZJZ4_9GAMM|nr:hypothetical protein [Zooshikella harenae]MBU2714401.1 hypothetical protein [Zooshikella harenae]